MRALRHTTWCWSLRDRRRSASSMLLAVTVLFLLGLPLAAQQRLSFAGKEFFITFPDTVNDNFHYTNYPLDDDARLIFFSQVTAHVTISAPGYQYDVTVLPNASTVVDLNHAGPSVPPIYCASRNRTTSDLIHVVSDANIIVYCYYATVSGSEAFTPLPVESWGTEYSLVTFPTTNVSYRLSVIEEASGLIAAPAQTIVIASQDNTQVTVEPGSAAGSTSPLTVTLNAGEAYLFETLQPIPWPLYGEDFSGSHLVATHPVGVLSGTTRSDGFIDSDGSYISGNTVKNTLAEWLVPVTMHGRTFVYRPIMTQNYANNDELVRVTSSSAGMTGVSQIGGTAKMLAARSFVDYFPSKFGLNGFGAPFAVQTDRPAQTMLITGSHYGLIGDISTQGTAATWTRAMAEMVPHERWSDSGRFYTPDYPSFLTHSLSIVADSSAMVVLDGQPVQFSGQAIVGTTFKSILIPVWPGDHTLRATRGRFAAIAFGNASGSEMVRPAKAHRGDEGGSALQDAPEGKMGGGELLHRTVYDEVPAIAYAYPVVGTQLAQGLLATSREECDSIIYTIRSTIGSFPPGAYSFLPGTLNNMTVEVDTVRESPDQNAEAYLLVFRPIDPGIDGSGEMTLMDENGIRQSFPATYRANRLNIIPNLIDLQNVTPGIQIPIVIWLRNRNPYPVTITSGALRSGFQGFRFKVGTSFPIQLAAGDSIPITLLFLRVDYEQTFTDQLVLGGGCHNDTVQLTARTMKAPSSHIGGNDWGARWVTSLSPCTKNGAASYDTTIAIYNTGGEDFTVASLELIGDDADAGYFQLDASDPTTTVGRGTLLQHGDTVAFRRLQRVRFRPKDERDYFCIIRMITDRGDTLEGVLKGSGIETHLGATGHTFPPIEMIGTTPVPSVPGTVMVAANPTRALTIRELRLVGVNASRFTIAPADLALLPRTLAPGEQWSVGVAYQPAAPGVDSARLLIVGDESGCEDSTALLAGSSFRYGITPDSADLGTIFLCGSDSGTVRFVNNGTVPLVASRITENASGALLFPLLAIPAILQPGDSLVVPFHIARPQPGPFDAEVTLSTTAADGTRPTAYSAHVHALLVGSALYVSGDRSLRLSPGKSGTTMVRLDSVVPAADLPIDSLELQITYNHLILRLANGDDCASLLKGTVLQDWSCMVIANQPGAFDLLLTAPPSASPLHGSGVLANLAFDSYLGDSLGSEIGVELVPLGLEQCVPVHARAGRIALDSICGLSFRLFEMTAAKFAIAGNRPNPFNATTDIDFSIGLDGPVHVSVMDASGREIATLVDDHLTAGNYVVRWDASRFASGLYYCRLSSETWSGIRPMMLVK